MKNSLVLEQDYLNIIQTLPAKEQVKVYNALFAFARGELTTNLKKKALIIYNQIVQLIHSKAKEKSEKYRDNIRKRWNKENTTVSNENTIVSNKNTTVSVKNTIVSNDLYNCIETPINKQFIENEGQYKKSKVENSVDNSEVDILTETEDLPNINNNIINTQSKREDIVNNNVSYVSYVSQNLKNNINKNNSAYTRVNIFNSNNVINRESRAETKPELQRDIFYNLYKTHPSQVCGRNRSILFEIIDTIIEALEQSNSPLGLKFRQATYHLNDFLYVVLGLSQEEIFTMIGQLDGLDVSLNSSLNSNKPYYILGMIFNLSKEYNSEPNLSKSSEIIQKLFVTNETSTVDSTVEPILV